MNQQTIKKNKRKIKAMGNIAPTIVHEESSFEPKTTEEHAIVRCQKWVSLQKTVIIACQNYVSMVKSIIIIRGVLILLKDLF